MNSSPTPVLIRRILQQMPVRLLPLSESRGLNGEAILAAVNELDNGTYKQQLLKRLLTVLDTAYAGSLYEQLAQLYTIPESDLRIITYVLPNESRVKLVENKAIISNGTTGLVTWPPSLAIIEYLLRNRISKGLKVLELGSGSGLLAIVLSLLDCQVTATDHHPTVLERIENNARLNHSKLSVYYLDWCSPIMFHQDFDLIVGVDIIFDPSLIEPLVELLKAIATTNNEILLAVTQRNQETFGQFKARMSMYFTVMEQECEQNWFYYGEGSPISIFRLVLK